MKQGYRCKQSLIALQYITLPETDIAPKNDGFQ